MVTTIGDLEVAMQEIISRVAELEKAVFNPGVKVTPVMTDAKFDPTYLWFDKLYQDLSKLKDDRTRAFILSLNSWKQTGKAFTPKQLGSIARIYKEVYKE